MDIFSTKFNSSSMKIDYFGKKKVKISNQTLWAKHKIGSLKTFHFPHLKYQFPKGGEQNHPSVKYLLPKNSTFYHNDLYCVDGNWNDPIQKFQLKKLCWWIPCG